MNRLCLAAMLMVAGCATGSPAAAGDDAVLTISSVSIGFGGHYKVGRWTPMSVGVETQEPLSVSLSVKVSDPSGCRVRLPVREYALNLPGHHELPTLILVGRLESEIEVEIANESGLLARRRLRNPAERDVRVGPALKQSATVWATIGDPAGFGDNGAESQDSLSRSGSAVHVARLSGWDQLPIDFRAYDGLDALIVNGALNLDEQRNTALRDWVRTGGRLLLAIGRHASAYAECPLASWVPVDVAAGKPLLARDVSALESFAGSNQRIPYSDELIAARLQAVDGEALVATLDTPLLFRVSVGFGNVTVLATDLDQGGVLARWKGLESACLKMIADKSDDSHEAGLQERGRLSHTGISELATQLHAIQEHFPEVHRYSSWKVMGMLLLYLLAIGPIDYLLVHRLLKKPRLTWCTFPLMVAVAAGLAMAGATSTNGNAVRLNQLTVVDIDAATTGFGRAQSWLTLYSPQTRRYSAAIETRPLGGDRAVGGDAKHAPPQQAPISWSGIPEASFGGMYRPGGLELGRPEYRFSADGTSIEDLPVSIWSTKSLTARWQFDDDALVESKLESPGLSQLFGTFTHHLPVPIEDWIVAYGNRVFRPRGEVNPAFEKIRPGELWNPSAASVHQRELRGFLTRAKVYKVAKKEGFGEDILIRQDPYDPLDLDPTDLLRLLTFHAAAGGSNYTGLENTALPQFDLSPLLQLDRAVLFGRIKMSVAVPRIDGEAVEPTQQVAFVRILLPVKRVESGPRILPDLGDEVIKLQHLKREEAEKKLKKDEK